MIKIDFATKIVSPETSLWVVFPGRARRLLNIFLSNDVIFLETPGINLTPQIANNVSEVRRRTRMAGAITDYINSTTPSDFPSRNPQDYSDGTLNEGGLHMLAVNVRKMFGKMKSGDLIVVPDRQYAPIHFAEIISEFRADDTISIARYPNEAIPFRRVKWLNDGVSRNVVPIDLQQRYLSKPPAITHVARSTEADEFFKLAYPSFILAEKSAVIMNGPRYDGQNPLATHEANYLVAYFIAAFAAQEQNRLKEFGALPVHDAIKQFFDRDLIQSFTQNYNSPGKSGLSTRSAILGAFVSASIAVVLAGLSFVDLQSGVEITNSVSAMDAQTHEAGVTLDYVLKSLGEDQINALNHLGDEAKRNIGLTTPVIVEVPKHD